MSNGYANPYVVADAEESVRAEFIRKTYIHLALAIAAFVGVEWVLFQIPAAISLAQTMTGSGTSWLIVLGAWMFISWIADRWASSDTSRGMQYAGLGLYVVGISIVFLPILLMASMMAKDVIPKAAGTTGLLFVGLTAVAFFSKKDFSFFRSFLVIGGFVAMGIIVVSLIFGFDLGVMFAGGMVLFAAIAILYTTSNIIRHYRPDQYVAASLGLFANVALMFFYILRIFMSRD